jgi:PBSX family phage terminase large subunit
LAKVNYKLNQGQSQFLREKAKQAAICGGLGSGKSWILVLCHIVKDIIPFPNAKHCFAALSYRQLEDTSIPLFESFLDEMQIPFEFKKSDKKFIINGRTELLMRSADTANKMRSVEVASLYLDELAYWDEDAFKTFLGRLRDKRGSMRMRAATTPNGLNWFYKYFVEQKKEDRAFCKTSTRANVHLPLEYIKMLEDSYDDELLEQELNGGFINIGATKTYYKFDRQKHTANLEDHSSRGFVFSIGMDFNVNPMTAVCGHYDGDVIYIVDEIHLSNSDTFKMREVIKQRYGTNLLVIPDATGSSRKTCATKSDHELLREYFNVARVRNPHRKDRFACVNNLLSKSRIFIDKKCTHLIKDLEQFCDNGSDESLGHISDALGYMCWYYSPIRRLVKGDDKPVVL